MPRQRPIPLRHAMLPPILLALLLTAAPNHALDLASRCSNAADPGECPCSRRVPGSSLEFCLSAASLPGQCRQRACAEHYVCDCSGDTLCRSAPVRSTLDCVEPVAASGECACERHVLRGAAGVQDPSSLIPLRPFRPLVRMRAYMPPDGLFCSERPAFWADRAGQALLRAHWSLVSERAPRDAPPRRATLDLPLLRFGHFGHAVSFSTPDTLSHALHNSYPAHGPIAGDFVDPHTAPAVNHMVAECLAASISVRLATAGIATRPAAVVPAFDINERMVLQACPHLPKDNPAVGMAVGRVLERAMLATGEFPLDDSALSHDDAAQACIAINRNFESCEVDLGCIAVTS